LGGEPEFDGAGVVAALRGLEAGIAPHTAPLPVIAMTGQTDRIAVTDEERARFCAWLTKPVAVPALVEAIGEATGRVAREERT
jgi:ATP-binding cassette subfamily B protein